MTAVWSPRWTTETNCTGHTARTTPKLETHKSTHLINAFLLVHHPSAHRTETAALPFSTLQWKPDPGDPLLYRSPAQEREVGAAMAVEVTGRKRRRRKSRGGGRGEGSWRGKSGKRRKQEKEEGKQREGGREGRCCRLKHYLLLHLPHLSLRGTNKKRTTLRRSCSISARLRGGEEGYTGLEGEGSVINVTGQRGLDKNRVIDDWEVKQQLNSNLSQRHEVILSCAPQSVTV